MLQKGTGSYDNLFVQGREGGGIRHGSYFEVEPDFKASSVHITDG